MATRSIKPKRGGGAWPIVCAGFAIWSLLPRPISGIAGWLRDPLETVLAPVSGPVSLVSDRLRGGSEAPVLRRGESAEELARAYDELSRTHLATLARMAELESLVRELQSGVPFPVELGVRRVEASRVGSTPPSTIEVNRGWRAGVEEGATIAVARGSQQLVGVVSRAGASVSTVRLLTDPKRDETTILAVVVPEGASIDPGSLSTFARLGLRVEPGGVLVENEAPVDVADSLELGDVVRLWDDGWPSVAQMFVLGRVVAIEETPEPLFKRVVVRPTLEDLTRVRSVILHVPSAGDMADTEGGGS